jgi:hypothetical protein
MYVLRSSALMVLLLSARALAAADPPFAAFVPADTRFLAGIEVRAIVDSDWGKAAIEQVKSAAGDAWMKGMPFKGVDVVNDVDEVWVTNSSLDQKSPSLVILRGRFDKSRLPAAIGRYHSVPLIPQDARREQLVAMMDASTIFAGDRLSVERAIDRHGLKSVDARLATAATALRARYWVWAVADQLDGVPAWKTAPQFLDGVDGFEFGLSMNRDLELAAQIHMRTAEAARKMLGNVALLQTLAEGQQKGASPLNVVSRATDKTVDVSLRVPEEELKQAWERQRAQVTQSLTQLPQQITAARAGKPFNPMAAPAQAKAPAAASQAKPAAAKQTRVLTDEDGNTVQLTLPGR